MFPSAPSQPRRASLKQAVWTSGGVGNRRQCCPPSAGLRKCTARTGSQGSASACQLAPPSVVARTVVAPTTQPCLASVKSTVASPAFRLVRYWATQRRPPSAVCRIRSEPTTQPSEADTNWTAFSFGFPVVTDRSRAAPGDGFSVALACPVVAPQDGLGDGLAGCPADRLAKWLAPPAGTCVCAPQPAASASASPSRTVTAGPAGRALVRRRHISLWTAPAAFWLHPRVRPRTTFDPLITLATRSSVRS